MASVNQFLNSLGMLGFLILLILGLAWISFRVFCSKYSEEIAKNIANNVNLADQIKRMVAHEEAKAITLRLDATKAEGAMKLQGLMAEIESILVNWRLTAYFHKDELKEGETIEDLGSRDLKKLSQLIIKLLKEANTYSVLIGDDILADIMNWVTKIHELIFDYEAVYIASKKLNEDKPMDHTDRVTSITNLMKNEVDPKVNQIGELRDQIKKKLSENIRRTIAELVG
jgi:hypothetical protein